MVKQKNATTTALILCNSSETELQTADEANLSLIPIMIVLMLMMRPIMMIVLMIVLMLMMSSIMEKNPKHQNPNSQVHVCIHT